MAGIQPPYDAIETLKTMKHLWQIHYSRFFTFPNLQSTCPTLKPISSRCIKRNPHGHGKWLSSSSMASLYLTNDHKFASGPVLIISCQGKVYVSCMEECPVRGGRVIFASYRDSSCQVQKFAVRFSSSSDSQTFVNSLKEGLKEARNIGHTNSTCRSKMTYPFEHISTKAIHQRPVEELSNAILVGNYETVVQPISNYESIQYTCPGDPILADGSGATCAPLPSSFTAFLSDSCTKAEEAEPPTATEAFYLDTGVMGGMTSSSFHNMLMKLEMYIDELGGDLAL